MNLLDFNILLLCSIGFFLIAIIDLAVSERRLRRELDRRNNILTNILHDLDRDDMASAIQRIESGIYYDEYAYYDYVANGSATMTMDEQYEEAARRG